MEREGEQHTSFVIVFIIFPPPIFKECTSTGCSVTIEDLNSKKSRFQSLLALAHTVKEKLVSVHQPPSATAEHSSDCKQKDFCLAEWLNDYKNHHFWLCNFFIEKQYNCKSFTVYSANIYSRDYLSLGALCSQWHLEELFLSYEGFLLFQIYSSDIP